MREAYLHRPEREIHKALQEKGNHQRIFQLRVYFGYLQSMESQRVAHTQLSD